MEFEYMVISKNNWENTPVTAINCISMAHSEPEDVIFDP